MPSKRLRLTSSPKESGGTKLGRDGNRGYNSKRAIRRTAACRGTRPRKEERGTDTKNGKFVEALSRGQGGSACLARREFFRAAGRIGGGDGPVRLRQIHVALHDRRPRLRDPWNSPGGRQRSRCNVRR